MATKKDVSDLLAGADDVSVVLVGKDFEVGFAFSNTLVNRLKAVPEAVFNEADNVWRVPVASAKELIAAVADMRDFNRQGGVQVTDIPAGKLVAFDYDKNLARLIGPLDGAEFSRKDGCWIVPTSSKALLGKDGQAPYFDKVINDMRGIVLETRQDYEAILEGAAHEAAKLKLKPGIHHPKADHSYTGRIVQANGYWAAQLSGIDDRKGVAFITLHKQAELGQDVFKGDELRIDYGQQREVRVRTTEVFRQQQAEREKFSAVAADKIVGGVVFNASAKDGQSYSGRIIEVGAHFVLQHTGREKFAIHDLERLKGPIKVGTSVDVKYKDGKGVVDAPEVGRSQGVGR